ncbi:MAG: hypothetical protein ACNA8K_14810 [Cyclonatronaceae bacterium]
MLSKPDSEVADGNSLTESFFDSSFYNIIRQERIFLIIIGVSFFVAGVVFNRPDIAMWVGFMYAGYSAIANDSIQTIGTFLASNSQRRWWVLWLFIGGIFLVTVTYSWIVYQGDVSYERLTARGFQQAPTSFSFLQIAAPLFLLIITRLRMPVSTTFLILSCFSANLEGITGMLVKSISGYFVAFFVAIVVWILVSRYITPLFNREASKIWIVLQWITSGGLWAVWIMQDIANIAVYLPRSLGTGQFIGFAGFIFLGLGILFYLRGDRIQQIVTEKSFITDIRSATIIDFVYAFILFYFKTISVVPMSTTWVFIGLLAGRELAMTVADRNGHGRPMRKTLRLIGKDVSYAGIGLIISIILAIAINPVIKEELLQLLF